MIKHSRIIYFTVILGLSWSVLPGQSLRNIDARDLIGASSIRALAISPTSDLIIYELRTTDFESNIYRKHLWQINSQGTSQRQLTFSSGNEWQPLISPDGHCIAFLSDRLDEKQKSATRIWAMSLSGGEAKPLTSADTEILDFKWSSDASHIFYMCYELKPKQTEKWELQREKTGFDALDRTGENPRVEIWKVAKSTGKHERLFVGDPGISAFDINPAGDKLIYSTNYCGDENDWIESDIFLFSIPDSSPAVQLTKAPGVEEEPRFAPDGKQIAYLTVQDRKKPFSQSEVELLSLIDKKVTRITKGLDLGVTTYHWVTPSTLLLEVQDGLENHLYMANAAGAFHAITGGSSYIFKAVVNRQKRSICAVRQTATSLSELIFSQGSGHAWKQLTNYSASLDQLYINPQTTFQWMSRDQRYKLEGLVVLPKFSEDRPLPLIVDIHGGPAGRTDIALEQFSLFQAWASQGFAVFSPNFRGSEGYGAGFQVANYRDLGGADYHDIMTGVKDLIKRGVAHPDSLVIMGGSYGGYMTNWVITQTKMFKVAVSRYGIFDLKNDFSNSNYAQWELDYLGKPYWDDPAAYRRMSPSAYIKNVRTPTLILHGADDENTFTSNSRELARALKTLNIPYRFFLYPREGHGMDEPNHRLDVFERQLSWVDLNLNRNGTLLGTDWLSDPVQIQILSSNPKARFSNKGDEKYLLIKILIDGSRLTEPQTLELKDFTLQPGNVKVSGLPSGEFLLPASNLQIEIGPDKPTAELKLVFPAPTVPVQELEIKRIGRYSIPR